MDVRATTSGFTLVELVTVIAVVGIMGIFSTNVLFDDLEYQRLSQAAHRAQVIATAIEQGKKVGAVADTYGGSSLGRFIQQHQNGGNDRVTAYMPELLNETDFFDYDSHQFFFVRVSPFSTQVSFTIDREPLYDVAIRSAAKSVNIDDEGAVTGVTWTLMPQQGHGLFAAYAMGRFINHDE